MKRFLLSVFLLFSFLTPCAAIGININFGLGSGIGECFGGGNVQKNENFWDSGKNFIDYTNPQAYITTDIVFTELFSLETGFAFRTMNLHYTTTEGNIYGNGVCHLNYSTIQLPILAKFVIPIRKTTELVNSINLSGGINVSFNLEKQVYSDSLTNYYGKFINPFVNVNASLQAVYSHRVGPGRIFAGLQTDINFIPVKYLLDNRTVNIGNIFTVTPVIGYTFIIVEDKHQSKVTEKNKRIRDIEVRD